MEVEEQEEFQLNPVATNQNRNNDCSFGKYHEWKRLSLIIATSILFILTLIFNYFASTSSN